MNHVYRLVWSDRHSKFVVAHEKTRTSGRASSKVSSSVASVLLSSLLVAPSAWAAPPTANTLPTGAQVSAGTAAISTSGNTMNVQQSTQRAAINWTNFSIGSNATVNFQQPNASALVLNRVVGNEQSVINGALNANGQVFLLNSNGVLFGQGASVNVGGLVASTLNQSDADFMAGRTTFERNGSRASVINLGTITAADGGYVALLGNQVSNQGVITARMGTAALAAGDKISLNFNGNSLVGVTIDQGTLDALVENKQAIYADGGMVVLTAKAADAVLGSLVNNTGEIRAQTVANQEGKIYLLGDMENGTVKVDGTLDARALNGGNGGFVETSAAHVKVADSAHVTTLASNGQNGTWLIDPNDFTVAASGGDMTGAAVGTALAGGNFTIQSTQGATSGNGDIFVNNNVTWTSGNTLTLNAVRNITINSTVDASGGSGGVVNLYYGQGAVASGSTATYDFGLTSSGFAGKINLKAGQNFNTKLGSDGVVSNWTVITALGAQGDEASNPANSLQALANSANSTASGKFVLGNDINASATANWNNGAGFWQIGYGPTYQGSFDGLGHRIQGLVIDGAGWDYAGLFAQVGGSASVIQNLGLVKLGNIGAITNSADKNGALIGGVSGGVVTIRNVYSNLNVTGGRASGGLLGYEGSSGVVKIYSSFSTGDVSSGLYNYAGGLVGYLSNSSANTIDSSYATGNVSGITSIGGLVGGMYGDVRNSYATGTVTGSSQVGGLIGSHYLYGALTTYRSYATGTVTGTSSGSEIGGLEGYAEVVISQSYATGNVVASNSTKVGGLVGRTTSATLNSYATGAVSGSDIVGGLVGSMGGNVNYSFSTGVVTGGSSATQVGGLIGSNIAGSATESYWDMLTSAISTSVAGTGKTTAEMKALNLFSTVSNPAWSIVSDGALSVNYPQLRWATTGTSTGSSIWVIAKPEVTYTVTGANKIYGQTFTLPTPTYTGGTPTGTSTVKVYDANNNDVTSQAVSGTLPVGTYSVKDTLIDNNYQIATSGNTNGTLVVTQATVTYTVTGANKSYGQTFTLPTPTYTGGTPTGISTVKVYDANNNDVTSQAVAGTLAAGSYTVKDTLTDTNYTIASSGNTNGTLVISATLNSSSSSSTTDVERQISVAANAPREISRPQITSPRDSDAGKTKQFTNVATVPSDVTLTFNKEDPLAVLSSPDANEPTQTVTLADAKKMLKQSASSATDGGGTGGDREVRVPVSRNSLAEIVNGGVKLPTGVEQQLFVVKAN